MNVRSGFTLLEMLIVIAIIGSLASIAAISYKHHIDNARKQETLATIHSIKTGIIAFEIDHMRYPKDLGELLLETEDDYSGPYLDEYTVPKDAWGNDFHYSIRRSRILLYSAGKDGRMNTPDDIPPPKV